MTDICSFEEYLIENYGDPKFRKEEVMPTPPFEIVRKIPDDHNPKWHFPVEYMPGDIYGWYPRYKDETKGDWAERIKSYGTSDFPKGFVKIEKKGEKDARI